jgi:large subunit ribosomal protein L29
MKTKEIRQMANADLAKRVDDGHEELFNLRFQLATGKAKNYKRVREVKRDIARIMSVLNERGSASNIASS